MSKSILLFFASVFLLIACSSSPYKAYEERLNTLSPNLITDYKNIVIIPNEGCSGCIGATTLYLIDSLEYHKNTLVMFTGIVDRKQFHFRIPKRFTTKENVIVDEEDVFRHSDVASIYPQIIIISEGKVEEVAVFNLDLFKSQ